MTTHNLNYQRVAAAIEYLTENFKTQPDLNAVAAQVHLSPEHFQRIFTEWAGVSPKKFAQYLTLDFLRSRIHAFASVQDAAAAVGLSAQSRVYDLFVNIEGVTPGAYRQSGLGLTINYGYHSTPFGMCFIAATDRGICGLSFIDEDQQRTEFEAFRHKWNFAVLQHAPDITQRYVQQIFTPEKTDLQHLTILAQGTNFQLKVWEALLKIPSGAVTTYEQIARAVASPNAVRAVGSAVGANPIGFLIPCHRVIRKAGNIGQYHWGSARKTAMIGWEMAHTGPGSSENGRAGERFPNL